MARIRSILQPIVPSAPRHADELRALITLTGASKFTGLCAFVTSSGVAEVSAELKGYKGSKKLFVGIQNDITTAQGLEALLVCGVDVSVVMNAVGCLYHPKMFSCESPALIRVLIGSANLTGAALLDNVEVGLALDLDPTHGPDSDLAKELLGFETMLAAIGAPYVRKIDASDVPALLAAGDVRDERRASTRTGLQTSTGKALAKPMPSPFSQTPRRPKIQSVLFAGSKIRKPLTTKPIVVGVLAWRKSSISATDAQRPPGARSQATGNLRLTRSAYKSGDKVIDNSTYFRNVVFASLGWDGTKEKSEAHANIRLTIRGVYYGAFEVVISHMPSRASGQGNVTTVLHWGPALPVLQQTNITGLSLELYGPDAAGVYDIMIA